MDGSSGSSVMGLEHLSLDFISCIHLLVVGLRFFLGQVLQESGRGRRMGCGRVLFKCIFRSVGLKFIISLLDLFSVLTISNGKGLNRSLTLQSMWSTESWNL